MLEKRPDLARALVSAGQRVMIMGVDEQTTDVPEQRDWKKPAIDDPRLTLCERKYYAERIGRLSDSEYWNKRARGMGGLLTSGRSEEHTSELQSLMRISYAVFSLKKKKT